MWRNELYGWENRKSHRSGAIKRQRLAKGLREGREGLDRRLLLHRMGMQQLNPSEKTSSGMSKQDHKIILIWSQLRRRHDVPLGLECDVFLPPQLCFLTDKCAVASGGLCVWQQALWDAILCYIWQCSRGVIWILRWWDREPRYGWLVHLSCKCVKIYTVPVARSLNTQKRRCQCW